MVLVATIIIIILLCTNLFLLVWPAIGIMLLWWGIDKWSRGGVKQKEYYFDKSGRMPLTRFNDYCTPKYQKFFKEQHKK